MARAKLHPLQAREPSIQLALDGPTFAYEPDVSPHDWADLRADVWKRWESEVRAHRRRPWPPEGARHDGLHGDALRRMYDAPGGYVHGWNAEDTVAELVAEARAELEALPAHVRAGIPELYVEAISWRASQPYGDFPGFTADHHSKLAVATHGGRLVRRR